VPGILKVILLLLPFLLVLFLYRDLVFSRFIALDTPIEARSIQQRLYDTEIALRLIIDHPWSGVGLGYYVDSAQLLDPNASRVHNVPLLVTAELGFPGLLLWLGLVLAPLWVLAKKWKTKGQTWQRRQAAAQLAPWLAMLVINLFDTMLWFSSNWQTAILFALLAAHVTAPATTASGTDQTTPLHEG
jgi:O-antigen ligase